MRGNLNCSDGVKWDMATFFQLVAVCLYIELLLQCSGGDERSGKYESHKTKVRAVVFPATTSHSPFRSISSDHPAKNNKFIFLLLSITIVYLPKSIDRQRESDEDWLFFALATSHRPARRCRVAYQWCEFWWLVPLFIAQNNLFSM